MIHETAVVAPEAKLGEGVQVGPFCVVGPSVELGAGTVLEPHAVVTGRTTIGEGTHVGSFAVLGGAPQHSRHEGVPGTLRIGPRSTIREHVTVHISTGTASVRQASTSNGAAGRGGTATTLCEQYAMTHASPPAPARRFARIACAQGLRSTCSLVGLLVGFTHCR